MRALDWSQAPLGAFAAGHRRNRERGAEFGGPGAPCAACGPATGTHAPPNAAPAGPALGSAPAIGAGPVLENPLTSLLATCYPKLGWLAEFFNSRGDTELTPLGPLFLANGEFNPWASPGRGTAKIGALHDESTGLRPAGSPAKDRLCIAVSRDGRAWMKTGLVVLDHAAVPCLAVEAGVLYLYCNCIIPNAVAGQPERIGLAVAWTTDMATWNYKELPFNPIIPMGATGETWESDPMDPTVAPCPEGGWYLFFTLTRKLGFAYDGADTFVAKANSLASASWTLTNLNKRVYPTDADEALDPNVEALDPCVFWMGSYFQYFSSPGVSHKAPVGTQIDSNHDVRLTESHDQFSVVSASSWTAFWHDAASGGDYPIHMTNGAQVGVDVVWYAMAQVTGTASDTGLILSYTWNAATQTWLADNAGTALLVPDRTYESGYVIDAAVVQFGNCYVMAYTTGIPA